MRAAVGKVFRAHANALSGIHIGAPAFDLLINLYFLGQVGQYRRKSRLPTVRTTLAPGPERANPLESRELNRYHDPSVVKARAVWERSVEVPCGATQA